MTKWVHPRNTGWVNIKKSTYVKHHINTKGGKNTIISMNTKNAVL